MEKHIWEPLVLSTQFFCETKTALKNKVYKEKKKRKGGMKGGKGATIGQIMTSVSPKDVYTEIPGNCHYVILHGKRDYTDVIKIRDLEMW